MADVSIESGGRLAGGVETAEAGTAREGEAAGFEIVRRRSVLTVGVVIILVVPAVWFATSNGDAAIHAALAVAYLAFLALAIRICRDRTPWPYASPIVTLTVLWLLNYGIAPARKFLHVEEVHASLQGSYAAFHTAFAMTLLSNALLLAGYVACFPGRIVDSRPRVLKGVISLPGLLVVWMLSLGARGVQFANKQYGYLVDQAGPGAGGAYSYQMVLTYLAQAVYLVVAALTVEIVLDREKKHPEYRYILTLVILLEVGYSVNSGFKAPFLFAMLPGLLVMLGMRARVPMRPILAAGLLLVFVAPGNYRFREAFAAGDVPRGDFLQVTSVSLGLTVNAWASEPGKSFSEVVTSISFEAADALENMALIVKKTPSQIPHIGAEEYKLIVPRTLFPRFLWKDKPTSESASIITRVYRESSAKSAAPMGFVGDFYMRTGWIGVIAGSFMVGLFLGLYLRIFQRFRSRKALIIFVAVLASTLYNSEPGPMVTMFVQRSLVYIAFAMVIYHGEKAVLRLRGDLGGA